MRIVEIMFIELKRKLFPLKYSRVKSGVIKNYLWRNGVMDNSYVLGEYEPSTIEILKKAIKEEYTCYDIGANTGYMSLVLSKLCGSTGKVYTFEPLPQNQVFINDHLKENNIRNTVAFDIALSDKESILQFTDSGNYVANTYISNSPIYGTSKKIEIKCSYIDKLIDENKVAPPDFIKIDVEGAEYDVLKGATETIKKFTPTIFVATHNNHNPGVKEKCLTLLESLNYNIKLINSTPNKEMQDFICTHEPHN
jgi:FkbM family methyltransferase